MIDPFGILGLILLLVGGSKGKAPATPAPTSSTPAPPPWPAALPPGLPPFPGRGWEYDEPPPPPVVERARQLVSTLWARGKGAHQTEQTGGRWITYRAEIVASGKQGVVAYRLATTAPPRVVPRPPSPSVPQSRAPRPPAPRTAPIPVPVVQTRAPAPGDRVYPVPGGTVTTAPPSSPVGFRLLKRGMGQEPAPPIEDVRLVQQRLGVQPANGRFGPLTEAAVKAYQRRAGLEVDGIVGPQTWTSLFGVRA